MDLKSLNRFLQQFLELAKQSERCDVDVNSFYQEGDIEMKSSAAILMRILHNLIPRLASEAPILLVYSFMTDESTR